MTISYVDVFGNTTVPPSEYGYLAVSLTANTQLYWPYDYSGTGQVTAKNMNVSSTAAWSLYLPAANQVSVGEDMLFKNVSAFTITIKDYAGTNTIATVLAGNSQYVCLTDSSTATGTWSTNAFGGSTASALTVTDDTTTNATEYPMWTTGAGSGVSAKISTTKLSFNPSTGILSATGIAVTSTAQTTNLNANYLQGLTTAQIATLQTSTTQNLSAALLVGLNTTQLTTLTTAQISAVGSAQITNLNANYLQGLTTAQIATLQTSTTQNLSAALLAGLNTTQLTTLTTTQVNALTTAQVLDINVVEVGSLTTTQLAVLATNNAFAVDQTIHTLTVGLGASSVATNTAIGVTSLASITTGAQSTAIGYEALNSQTTGMGNTAVGYHALKTAQATGDGYATAIGHSAGLSVTTSADGVFVGRLAGSTITVGVNGIYLGSGAAASANNANHEIVIGSNATGKGTNTAFISANSGSTYNGANVTTWATVSDRRVKENIVALTGSLALINRLNPCSFNYLLLKNPDGTVRRDVSFIAQEYMTVLPEQVSKHVASPEEAALVGEPEIYGIQQNLVPYLVNAIQELDAKFEAYKATHP